MYSGLRFLNNIIISLKGHGMLVIMIASWFNKDPFPLPPIFIFEDLDIHGTFLGIGLWHAGQEFLILSFVLDPASSVGRNPGF